MSLSNDRAMLIYGLGLEEKEILNGIMDKFKLPQYKTINKYMADMKIKDIVAGLKFETYTGTLNEEKTILFNNFSDADINKTIKAIRESIKESIIMAVITPTSANWTFKYLLEHLIEEREWFRTHKS